MRILNGNELKSHGNISGREDLLKIMESGLEASDPYYNTKLVVQLKNDILSIGNPIFEATGDPLSGVDTYDINSFEHIYVIGAGKGVQRVGKALEEILGNYLSGGHLICKYCDEHIVNKLSVTMGNHPTPDENCVTGCKKILEIASKVTERDLVFTIIMNGGSSLLTLPPDGISVSDVAEMTYMMQIEKGIPTRELNKIRNHIDCLKGGKLARVFSKATLVNLAGVDLNCADATSIQDFSYFVQNNCWLHNMPEGSTYADAKEVLKRYDAWERCPVSIRTFLEKEDPQYDCVRYEEYKNYRARMFGLTPSATSFYRIARDCAEELGYHAFLLSSMTSAEASAVGSFIANMAKMIESGESSIKAPAALVFSGEMVVTVGKNNGIGGRNQEFCLSFAKEIAGSKKILAAAADTDGTDGPGGFEQENAPACLSGGMVDGYTCEELKLKSIDINKSLKEHSTTYALYNTDNAIYAQQGVSVNDLMVVLIQA